MHTFGQTGDRQFCLLTSGNLATAQGIVSQIRHDIDHGMPLSLMTLSGMHEAADYIGQLSVMQQKKAGGGIDFEASVLFGGQILGAAPEMFQDMALLKPPRIGREKPWHQDLAYFDVDAQSTPVVGCWIALDEATAGNGCMHVIPGSHKAGPQPHFAKRDWQLCDAQMQGRPCAVVPLKPGGLMLFDGLIQHGTPTNHSTSRRRALQFHYRPAGTKLTAPEVRLQVWGAEGKNVDC